MGGGGKNWLYGWVSDGGECRPAVTEGEDACFSDGCETPDEAVNWPSVEFEAMRVSGDGR